MDKHEIDNLEKHRQELQEKNEELQVELEILKEQLTLTDVVESFYCNSDDGEYNNNPCAEQCRFCKGVESLQ